LSGVRSFGESQRAELVARILNKAAKGTSGPIRGELLSTLLSDTANLTQFIRYSGLSEEVGAALLRDAMSATAKTAHPSSRSMGEINEMLSRVRLTTAGVDASYGAAASFGETGSGRLHPSAGEISDTIDNAPSGKTGSIQFFPFSPAQADFDKTIDNIWSGSNKSETPEAAFNLVGTPPQTPHGEGVWLASETFYLILVSLAGAVLLGIFVFVR
jgi:hypothetical protein